MGVNLPNSKVICLPHDQGYADIPQVIRALREPRQFKVVIIASGRQKMVEKHPHRVNCLRSAILQVEEICSRAAIVLGAPLPGAEDNDKLLDMLQCSYNNYVKVTQNVGSFPEWDNSCMTAKALYLNW